MTLLELLLALALTGVVMVIISMAIHLHLITLDTQRADVEQAMLARAVLRHMATDIRNAVWYEPIDMSSAASMAMTTDTSSLQGDSTGDGQNQDQQTPQDQGQPSGEPSGMADAAGTEDMSGLDDLGDLGLDTEPSENTADIAGTVAPASQPGLYGNQFELQIDCSRLPRVDQYSAVATNSETGSAVSIPSDVKTVAYFLRTDESSQAGVPNQGGSSSTGLVRREMDRAVASWASQDGSLDSSEHPGEILAKEVTYLEFRYFDGSSWYTEWDSEQMGGLPAAIEITISIDPAGGQNPQDMDVATATELAATDVNEYIFRLVVSLPVAQPIAYPVEESSETMDESSETTDGSSADTTQGGTGP